MIVRKQIAFAWGEEWKGSKDYKPTTLMCEGAFSYPLLTIFFHTVTSTVNDAARRKYVLVWGPLTISGWGHAPINILQARKYVVELLVTLTIFHLTLLPASLPFRKGEKTGKIVFNIGTKSAQKSPNEAWLMTRDAYNLFVPYFKYTMQVRIGYMLGLRSTS